MSYLAGPELAAAVSNAGALGILGSGYAPPDAVLEQVQTVRLLTDKPFGLNILLSSRYARDLVLLAASERIPVVTLGGGDPAPFMGTLRQGEALVLPVVGSLRAAIKAQDMGADGVIAEGMESGGHVGSITTMVLVAEVCETLNIPVVAAGGIADGRGLVAALALGAEGVQIGTRFVCCNECLAHNRFKQLLTQASSSDPVVIGATTGHPLRCIANKLTTRFSEDERQGRELEWYFKSGLAYSGMVQGDLENGFLMAGQCAGLIRNIKPAGSIVEDIMSEADSVLLKLRQRKN